MKSIGVMERDAEMRTREHNESIHEMRAVVAPGIELLLAVMLLVAFTDGLDTWSQLLRTLFYAAFICAGLSLLLLLATAVFHRPLSRLLSTTALLRTEQREALAALVLLSMSMTGCAFIIADVRLQRFAAIVIALAVFGGMSFYWLGGPFETRRQ
jgi:FtsH-binding integral membrane protein